MFGNSIKGSPCGTFSVIRVLHFKTSHFPCFGTSPSGNQFTQEYPDNRGGRVESDLHSDDLDIVHVCP